MGLGHEVDVTLVDSLLAQRRQGRIEVDAFEGVEWRSTNNFPTAEGTSIARMNCIEALVDLFNSLNVGSEAVIEAQLHGLLEYKAGEVRLSIAELIGEPDRVHHVVRVIVNCVASDHIPEARVLQVWLATGDGEDESLEDALLLAAELALDILKAVPAGI